MRRERAKESPIVPERVSVRTQRPIVSVPSDEEHQVLQFRPRSGAPNTRLSPPGMIHKLEVAQDLSRFERDREDEVDYRQRMLANIAAFAFTVALLAIGIWLTISIANLRRTQDCVLLGRHDCVRITTPSI